MSMWPHPIEQLRAISTTAKKISQDEFFVRHRLLYYKYIFLSECILNIEKTN